MLSIFVIYSKDRLDQFLIAKECIEEMEGASSCQKILCVDGTTNIQPDGWEVVEVARPGIHFNWAMMWQRAIEIATFETVLYLDSDRILPLDYLNRIVRQVKPNTYLYSKELYQLKDHCSLDSVRQMRDSRELTLKRAFVDLRFPCPPPFESVGVYYGKNAISGNTAFLKKTYLEAGGIDPGYEGYGFPDTEFFWRCLQKGFKFEVIDCHELHLHHPYAVEHRVRAVMNLYNAAKFCKQWSLRPSNQILQRAKDLKVNFDKLPQFPTLELALQKTKPVRIF
jgi:hypothetical protein